MRYAALHEQARRTTTSTSATAAGCLSWLPWDGLVLTTDLDVSHYAGLSGAVDPTTARWNVGLGYKFLPGDRAEVRLTVHDLLDQNASVGRTVTGTYVEDRQTEALGRYVMLHLSYKLRRFGG